jgi:hypothetical protein
MTSLKNKNQKQKSFRFLNLLETNNSNDSSIKISFYSGRNIYQSKQGFIVPSMAEFIRDVGEYGNIGAIKKRVLKLSLIQLLKLALWNITNILKIIHKDFSTGISILIQLELLQLQKYSPSLVVLSDQITDLSASLDNKKIIKEFFFITKRVGVSSAIMSNNPSYTIKFLSTCKVNPSYFFFPFNSFGFEMNPSQSSVEKYIRMLEPNKVVAITPCINEKEKKYLGRFKVANILVGWL